jgi:hypothetical protein
MQIVYSIIIIIISLLKIDFITRYCTQIDEFTDVHTHTYLKYSYVNLIEFLLHNTKVSLV